MNTASYWNECKNCGQFFNTSRIDARFCGPNCKAEYARTNGYYRERYHAEKEELNVKACEHCGQGFAFNDYAKRGGQRAAKYCSSKCRKAANRAKGKDAPHTDARDDKYKGTGQSAGSGKGTGQGQRQSKGTGQGAGSGPKSRTSNYPYDILGVKDTDSFDTIKRAYRKLITEWHPDRNQSPDATARCQEINNAWDKIRAWRGWK